MPRMISRKTSVANAPQAAGEDNNSMDKCIKSLKGGSGQHQVNYAVIEITHGHHSSGTKHRLNNCDTYGTTPSGLQDFFI
jgi:hypothetical protein